MDYRKYFKEHTEKVLASQIKGGDEIMLPMGDVWHPHPEWPARVLIRHTNGSGRVVIEFTGRGADTLVLDPAATVTRHIRDADLRRRR
ncbi:hypothetical protein ACFWFX_15420 [Streptomyces roseolus]|uniref:hypothetical protein n=1 Tax=Streptomyces roseolus TaxID=67358 RepID=UPI003653FE39